MYMLSLYIASPPDEATETKIKSDCDTGDVESGITNNHVIMHGFEDSSSYYNSTRVMNMHECLMHANLHNQLSRV